MRAGPLSDAKVVSLLNGFFVPVYVSNEDYSENGPAPAAEKAERRRIMMEARQANLTVGTVCVYMLEPEGKIIDTCRVPQASDTKHLTEWLEGIVRKLATKKGSALVKPAPQANRPEASKDALVLHLTARHLPAGGSWRRLPSEDWIMLKRADWLKLLPATEAKVGSTWELDRVVGAKLLKHFYPPTENNELASNRIDRQALKATVVSVRDGLVRARIDGDLKMKHAFQQRGDDLFVEAVLVGFVDFDAAKKQIKSLRLVTDKATYFKGKFGVAVRSVP